MVMKVSMVAERGTASHRSLLLCSNERNPVCCALLNVSQNSYNNIYQIAFYCLETNNHLGGE